MVIFLDTDGNAQIITPESVYQGSNDVIDITVVSSLAPQTQMSIGFILPNGLYWFAPPIDPDDPHSGGNYAPMAYVEQNFTTKANVWKYTLPRSVTEMFGTVKIAINATTRVNSDVNTVVEKSNTTSYLCEFTVQESVVPSRPPATPEPDVYKLLRQYLAYLDGRTANVPNLVAGIQKASGNSFTFTDNKGVISAPITLGVVDYNPTYVGAATVLKLPKEAWQRTNPEAPVPTYSLTITAAQHGQLRDGVTFADLSVSFKRGNDELITSPTQYTNYNASYTIYPSGNIVLTSTMPAPVSIVATIWNGKGLEDVTARKSIAAETTRAEDAEAQLQANIDSETDRAENAELDLQKQIDEITQSGVDLTARAEIAAETARAEIAEAQLQSDIAAERARAESAEQTLQHNIDVNTSDIDGLREDITNESHFRGMFDSVAALKEAYPTATPNDYAYIVGGNIYIWQNNEWTDSNEPSPNTAVPKGTATPLMDGVAQVGNSNTYADALHRHPTDTTKVNKSGDEMSGPLILPKLLGTGSTDARGVIPVKYIRRQDIGVGANDGVDAYLQAWIKKVCELYPNEAGCIFIGSGNPASQMMIEAFIYETNIVDVDGMPAYVIGIARQLANNILQFNVNNHSYSSSKVLSTDNDIFIEKSSGTVDVAVKRIDTGNGVALSVGSGGVNRGIWDYASSKWMMHANANHVYIDPPSSGGKVYINGVNPLARKAWTYNTNATKSSTGGMIEGTAYTFSGIFGIGGVPPQALGGLVKCSNVFGYIINQTTFISLKTVQATINAGDAINIYGFEVGE